MNANTTGEHPEEKSIPLSKLANQYGGYYARGWVSRLPPHWIPYVQLARLSPPAGLFLIYFPHLFGILQAAVIQRAAPFEVLRTCIIMLCGSFFYSNAIHTWNDIVDAPVDKRVARTSQRPIPRGAVSPRAAFIFTLAQAAGAGLVLVFCLPTSSTFYAIPNIIPIIYYPWAKKHTHFAQVVLGFFLGWGVFMGAVPMGVPPYTVGFSHADYSMNIPTVCLFLACICWTVIYDIIYAHQDVKDDAKIGLKSLAVLLGEETKPALWLVLSGMMPLLIASGLYSGMGLLYYSFIVAGSFLSLSSMIAMVDLDDPANCWWWFRYGFWVTGGSICAGLVLEYVVII
ncbi:UbiA-domain-containing protein [Xylariaceae sp. FL0662B]|nr:UbiA-domain-containing protein [Xylariaceae sp. FL0662B]